MEQDTNLTRRRAVTVGAVAAAGVVGVVGLAGCGSDDEPDGAGGKATTGGGGTGATGGATGAGALAKVADIPVGGVLVVKDPSGAPVVLTQPESGTVVGFSGKCTHQGCAVVADGKGALACPCHGSIFDATGKPTTGPAKTPLAAFAVTVDGENVVPG